MNQRLIEIGAFPIKAMVPIHLAVITHKNHERLLPLPRLLQVIHQTAKLIVNQLYLRIIITKTFSPVILRQRRVRFRLPILAALHIILLLVRRFAVQLPILP